MDGRVPAEVFSPGEILRDELEARDWSVADLVAKTGFPRSRVAGIIAGDREITVDVAVSLGRVFGVDPRFWLNLEDAYRISFARR